MWADTTDDFEYVPMSDIRIKVWSRQYPTWYDRTGEIFQTHFPEPKEVAKWKQSWVRSDNQVDTDLDRHDVFQQCKALRIHPYFWQYVTFDETFTYEDQATKQIVRASRQVIKVVFFYDEDFVMYKLKHG